MPWPHGRPELLLWAGVLTFAFGVVNLVTIPDEPVASWAVNVLIGPPPIDPDLSLSFAGPPTLLQDPPPVLHWWEHAGRPVWRSRGT